MRFSMKATFAIVAMIIMLGPIQARSNEWTRETRHGGEITRQVTRDGSLHSGQTTRLGPNGATYSSSSTCRDGFIERCRRTYSATGPNGQIYTGKTATARGPRGVRSIGAHTGPRGNVSFGLRRHWR